MGETLEVVITNSANSPEYQWYLNDEIIPGAFEDTYELDAEGDYMVMVTETVGCLVTRAFHFAVSQEADPFPDVAEIPNLISPNGDGTNDTWVIPNRFVSGTNTEIIIMDSYGKVVYQTEDYQNNWPENAITFKNVNPVFYYIINSSGETKKGSITIVK